MKAAACKPAAWRSELMVNNVHRRRDADPRRLEKYGDATFADPVNKKYPIDTPGRIKAAWAYLHQARSAENTHPASNGHSGLGFGRRRRRGTWRCLIRTSSWS